MTLAIPFPAFSLPRRQSDATPRDQPAPANTIYNDLDDNTLMVYVQARDQDAMLTLHGRYVNLLFSISLRVLHDINLAEESTQEAFFKVWQCAYQFSPASGTVAGWLARIARNMAIDRQRAEQRRIPLNNEFEMDDELGTMIADGQGDLHADEIGTAIRHALGKLPPEHAKLITLSYFGGLSHSDLSEMLGIPLGTVKTRIQMGMSRLRAVWKE
jgi:RNA polymerase sigma-70 factor, ECF subfamily